MTTLTSRGSAGAGRQCSSVALESQAHQRIQAAPQRDRRHRLGPAIKQEERVEQHAAALLLEARTLEPAPQQQVGAPGRCRAARSWRAPPYRLRHVESQAVDQGAQRLTFSAGTPGKGPHPVGRGGAVQLGTHGRAGARRPGGRAGAAATPGIVGNGAPGRRWQARQRRFVDIHRHGPQ